MERLELKSAVIELLQKEFDFTVDDAEEAVNDSCDSRPELWHENAEPSDLANFLASDENDD